MRTTMFAIVVAFALLVGAVPAQAQSCVFQQCGPADQLLNDNLDMVGRWMSYNGSWYYGYSQGGNFYGLYDVYRRPLPRKIRIPLAAVAGYSIGRGIGGSKGGWIGAGAAVAGELIYDAIANRGRDEDMVVLSPDQIPPPPTGGSQTTSGRENGWDEVNRRRQEALAGPAANRGNGEFTLVNATRFRVDVYDGDCGKECHRGRMAPDEEWQVPAPNIGYRGYASIPNSRGGLSKDRTDLFPSDNGWVFIEPSFGSGR